MEKVHHSENLTPTFVLQQATVEDCELMFRLQKLNGAQINQNDEEEVAKFEEYKNLFNPAEIQVIYLENEPIGRLRIVRGEELYIGGMQILPEHRERGIGTAVLEDLIQESNRTAKTIRLEVFHDNEKALNLYKKVGFKVVEENEQQKVMIYKPQ